MFYFGRRRHGRDVRVTRLSERTDTATSVGGRHGKPAVLTVDAARMRADGLLFYRTPNGVWLTDEVPAKYLTFP